MDNHQGGIGAFELIVKDNVTPETNAFVVSFGGVNNFGDLFSRIVLINNNLKNKHSAGLGKGVLAIDGSGGPRPFRSTELPIISFDNVLEQLDFRSGYAEASGSTGSIVGYATAQIEIPTIIIAESLLFEGESEYVQVSAAPPQSFYHKMKVVLDESGLISIDLDHEILPQSITVAVSRAMAHLYEDFEITVVDGISKLTWIGAFASDGVEALEVGDIVFITYAYLSNNSF